MTTTLCHHCGAEGPIVAKYCRVCGQKMTGSFTTVACADCGTMNPQAARCCRVCGGQLGGASASLEWFTSGLSSSFETRRVFRSGVWPTTFLRPGSGIRRVMELASTPQSVPVQAATPPANGLAHCSLAFGILSIVGLCMGPFGAGFAIAAIVCGVVGLSRAKNGAGNRERALAGLTLGIVSMCISLVGLLSMGVMALR